LKLDDGTIFGDDFQINDYESYFVNYFGNENPIKYLKVSNYSINNVTISFLTTSDYNCSILYGTEGNFDMNISESVAGKKHIFQIENLTLETTYNYKIDLGNSLIIDMDVDNQDSPFTFKTTPNIQNIVTPLTLGGKVIDGSGNIIENSIAYIWKNGTYPLMAQTNSNGIFFVVLSNFKDSTTGAQVSINNGDEIFIDIIDINGVNLGNKYILSGSSPYEAGIYELK